jgi:REP element-mobilizing transposase RayT
MRTGNVHFITSVVTAAALLGSARPRDPLLKVLEQVRRRYQFVVVGYVVMTEHVHLLISKPEKKNPLILIQATKLSFTRRVLAELRRRRDARQASLEHTAWQGCSRIFSEGYYPMSVLTSRLASLT